MPKGCLTEGCFSPWTSVDAQEAISWPVPSAYDICLSRWVSVDAEEDAFSRCTTSYIGLFDLPFPDSAHHRGVIQSPP